MALERLDRAANNSGAQGPDRVAPRPEEQRRAPEPERPRAEDAVEVRSYSELTEAFKANQERMARAMDGRRKILEAVREMMLGGGLETEAAAKRAADGILRRGAVRE